MSNFRESSRKAINLGKQLKAVIEVGEFLEQIGNFEQIRLDAENSAKRALDISNTVEKDLEQIKLSLSEAQHDRNIQIQDNKTFLSKVKDECNEIKQKADTMARKIIESANIESELVHERMSSLIQKLELKRDVLEKEVNKLSEVHEELIENIEIIRNKLA